MEWKTVDNARQGKNVYEKSENLNRSSKGITKFSLRKKKEAQSSVWGEVKNSINFTISQLAAKNNFFTLTVDKLEFYW